MSLPELRFMDFSGSWCEKKLFEIADIKTGPFGSTLHEEDYVETGTPIITVEHLGEQGVVHQNLPLVSDIDKARLKSYNLQQGDVVFSRVGSVDRSCLISEKENGWLFSGRLLRVRLTDICFCSIFLNQIFKNEKVKYRIRSVAVGQTMASLNTEILKNFSLIFPTSKLEQTKIANFLTAVDEKITQLTQKHDLLTQYKKGVMQKIFSQELRFKDDDGGDFPEWHQQIISNVIDNYGGTALEEFVSNEGTHHFISIGNYEKNGNYFDNGQRISLNAKTKQKLLNKGDLVMVLNDKTLAGDLIGSTILIREDNKFIYNQRSERLVCNMQLVVPGYIWQLFNSTKFRKEIFSISQGGTQIYVNFPAVKKLIIPVPSLKEQIKIANFLSAVDDKITATKSQLDSVKQYKQGLLQQMFV